MTGYGKGARGERELIHLFAEKGYSVIRAAGSGVAGECPDLLVFKRGTQYAFECKAWKSSRITIDKEHYSALKRWEENTGITTMLAWRMDRLGWFFIYLGELEENPSGYSCTKSRVLEIGRRLEDVLR